MLAFAMFPECCQNVSYSRDFPSQIRTVPRGSCGPCPDPRPSQTVEFNDHGTVRRRRETLVPYRSDSQRGVFWPAMRKTEGPT